MRKTFPRVFVLVLRANSKDDASPVQTFHVTLKIQVRFPDRVVFTQNQVLQAVVTNYTAP
jgi:hypothetical protein